MGKPVEVSQHGAVTVVTLERPDVRNAVDADAARALHQEWERGKTCIGEGLQGAARFAAGAGRHGSF